MRDGLHLKSDVPLSISRQSTTRRLQLQQAWHWVWFEAAADTSYPLQWTVTARSSLSSLLIIWRCYTLRSTTSASQLPPFCLWLMEKLSSFNVARVDWYQLKPIWSCFLPCVTPAPKPPRNQMQRCCTHFHSVQYTLTGPIASYSLGTMAAVVFIKYQIVESNVILV